MNFGSHLRLGVSWVSSVERRQLGGVSWAADERQPSASRGAGCAAAVGVAPDVVVAVAGGRALLEGEAVQDRVVVREAAGLQGVAAATMIS